MPYRQSSPELGCAYLLIIAALGFAFALGLVVGRCL